MKKIVLILIFPVMITTYPLLAQQSKDVEAYKFAIESAVKASNTPEKSKMGNEKAHYKLVTAVDELKLAAIILECTKDTVDVNNVFTHLLNAHIALLKFYLYSDGTDTQASNKEALDYTQLMENKMIRAE